MICSTPTAVKSFVIKLIEMLHTLDYASIESKERADHVVENVKFSLQAFFGVKQRPTPHSYTARPSRIPSLCTQFTRAGIEWRR